VQHPGTVEGVGEPLDALGRVGADDADVVVEPLLEERGVRAPTKLLPDRRIGRIVHRGQAIHRALAIACLTSSAAR
jgi:hypothetical protein